MKDMYGLAEELFPICRSISGKGVRETLAIIKREVPNLTICNVPSGTKVFDWTVPKEWIIHSAYIDKMEGNKFVNRVIDFKDNNLHVMGYSTAVDSVVDLSELKKHIYVQEDDEDAIPYVTSYYQENFGFCMSQKQKEELTDGRYHMVIDSEHIDGNLSYGEVIIRGTSTDEILISTYLCHPSMANDNLSGICVTTALCQYINSLKKRKYTYRILYVPETIGAIAYLSSHIEYMKKHTIAGYVITCVGDNLTYSYVATRYGDTVSDKVAQNVLRYYYPNYKAYSYLSRGSDERQYCAPGVDLPICTICRSKYHEYPEYHTSKDNLQYISREGLEGALEVYKQCLAVLEHNKKYITTVLCEPQLGKRGLYPNVSQKGKCSSVRVIQDFLAYADGKNDLLDISNIISVPAFELIGIADILEQNCLIKEVEKNGE